jgi:hypothetical protein
MTKIRLLIKIVSITIVTIFTIFLLVCITAGVLRWKHHSAHWTRQMSWKPPSPFFVICYESYDFVQDLYAAARYYCWPYAASDKWIECRKVKYVQRYLRNEKIQKIAFRIIDFEKGEIVEPEKIKRVLQLIRTAQEELSLPRIPHWDGEMIITTDKHKFVIPVRDEDKAICGLHWKSEELHKQLWEWGYGYKYKYYLPSKEQVIAILLYPHRYDTVHPLAIFSNEEDISYGIWIKDKEGKKIEFKKYNCGELKPKKIFEGSGWLEKIMDAYENEPKETKERKRYYPMELDKPIGWIVFMTQDWSYWKEIGIDANTVFDDYIKSERLKKYFDELGLMKELLEGEPNAVGK